MSAAVDHCVSSYYQKLASAADESFKAARDKAWKGLSKLEAQRALGVAAPRHLILGEL